MGKKPHTRRHPPAKGRSVLGILIRWLGWGRTIALVVVVGLALHFMPKKTSHHTPHHAARGAHHSPGPWRAALDHQLEEWRLAIEKTLMGAHKDSQKSYKRRASKRTFPPVTSPGVEITLGPKRIQAAVGDTDVPPHRKVRAIDDYKQYGFGSSDEPPSKTEMFYFIKVKNVASRPIKAAMGKLALRNKDGRALYIMPWHYPTMTTGYVLPPGQSIHEMFAEVQRGDRPEFRELLHTPPSELTLEWTPTFVCYTDGTMEGDVRATHYMDLEGLRVSTTMNGLRWVLQLQYPNGTDDLKYE